MKALVLYFGGIAASTAAVAFGTGDPDATAITAMFVAMFGLVALLVVTDVV